MTTDPTSTSVSEIPRGTKVANLLFQLRVGSDANLFGRMVYGLFWIWGVEGLPPLQNPPKMLPQISRIPRGYGLDFGKRVFGMAVSKFSGDRDKAEELLSEFLTIKVMDKQHKLADKFKGLPLKEAESIVMTAVKNFVRDTKRDTHREEKVEGPGKTDLSETQHLLNSPDQSQVVEELISEGELSRVVQEVQRMIAPKRPDIAKDIPLYFDLLMDGTSDSKIINNKMLPFLEGAPMSQQAWQQGYKEVIKKVMDKHLDRHADLHATASVVERLLEKTASEHEAKTMPLPAQITRLIVLHAKGMLDSVSGEADLKRFYESMAEMMEYSRLALVKMGERDLDVLFRKMVSELRGKSAEQEFADRSLDSLMDEKVAEEAPQEQQQAKEASTESGYSYRRSV